jgi:ribose transport system permease protein
VPLGCSTCLPARGRPTPLQVLQNLVNLLGIPSSLNFAVMGGVILVGVVGDQVLQRRAARAAARD